MGLLVGELTSLCGLVVLAMAAAVKSTATAPADHASKVTHHAGTDAPSRTAMKAPTLSTFE
jgi:hypothetical protein